MSKILAVADIHINDYANRNPSNRFRLYQGSRTVAKNIIDAGKREGCDIIVFAGDIVEKCIIRPYVQAEVKLFLDTIMSHFKEGYIIWGNHDLDGKSVDQDISDACLGVMLPSNLHYAHKKTIIVDGKVIGFCNWMPKFDLTWIDGKVDILFTHATICYSKNANEGRLFDSQELDESKFDLAICGDIHQKGQIGKYVSIGCAQRCKLSDPEEASGIVVDCSNKTWNWIDLNPSDNLMKFATTDILDEEGWKEDTHTWFVYKQNNSVVDPMTGSIKVNAWEEISSLVDTAIAQTGLGNIHQEVLNNISNIDSGEVDFNFTLLHLHCENWRSIKEIDIDFQDMDKILVLGSNGSGKSSLLSAIKYALCDVGDSVGLSSLKSFTTFGKKDCLTEITFLYQGNTCTIQRGTSKYGLWVNGEPFKYNSKKLFEKDARERFPFIKYMDAFFFDADKSSFLRSLSPERVTEITSKFLKLNRIDTYNEVARNLYEQVRMQGSEWLSKLNETERLIQYIDEKLNNLTIPTSTKQELINLKQEGVEIQRKNNLWNNYINAHSQLHAQGEFYGNKLRELDNILKSARPKDIIDSEINSLSGQRNLLQQNLVELSNIRTEIEYKERDLQRLKDEGNNYWREAKEIGLGKKCSKCGQIIQTSDALESHKNELLQKVEELKPIVFEKENELANLKKISSESDEKYRQINQELSNIGENITRLIAEKTTLENQILEYNKFSKLLSDVQEKINSLNTVEEVRLPENFMERMAEIEAGILSWETYESTINDKNQRLSEYSHYKSEVDKVSGLLEGYENYIKLTGPTGLIFEEIFNRLSTQFSSNTVKYVVERKGKGRMEHLNLVPNYNNSGNLVPINLCSSGQRTLLDIDYMSKIINRLGLLVLDEFFKNLDNDRLEEVLEILKTMNVGCIMLTSHAESIPAFNNKTYILSLNENGLSDIILK